MADQYAIVRREPTKEMVRHGAADCSLVTHRGAKAVYAAMISASPSPVPTGEPPREEVVEALRVEREAIAQKAREFSGHYPQSSDGRNTFVMLAEWIEARATLSSPSREKDGGQNNG